MSRVAPQIMREPSDDESFHRASRAREERGEVRSIADLVTRRLHGKNVTKLQEALKQLRREFSNTSDRRLTDIQDDLFDCNGHSAVVQIMLDNLDSKDIQSNGLRILMHATHRNTHMRNAVAAANGMNAIIAAMKQYTMQQDIQFYGLKSLESLCHLDSNTGELSHQLDAVPFIIETMKRFSEDSSIAGIGCDLLYQLSCNKSLRKTLLAAKVASAVALIYEIHSGNKNVQEAALDALNSLTKP
jgi:hypothetical protein